MTNESRSRILCCIAHTFRPWKNFTNSHTHLHIEKERQEEARKALLICTHYFQQESICHDDMSASARRLVDCRFSCQHAIPLSFCDSIGDGVEYFCIHSQKV